jgi:hypothetical protein
MNKKTQMFFLILFTVVLSTYASAATYYLDSESGDDSNDGLSPDNAWQSIDRAKIDWDGSGQKLAYGDTVIIFDGDYGGFSLSNNDLEPYDGDFDDPLPNDQEWVKYRAADGNDDVRFSGFSFPLSWTSDLFIVAHSFEGIKVETTSNCVYSRGAIGIRFLDMHFLTTKDRSEMEANADGTINLNFKKHNCDIHIIDSIIEGGYRGIYIGGSNVVIRSNDIFDIGVDKIMYGGGKNIIIEDNDLHSTPIVTQDHPDAIQFYTAADKYGTGARAENLAIINNRIYHHSSQGIWTGGSLLVNVTFTGNLVYDTGNYEWRVYGFHGGVFANNTFVADRTQGNAGVIFYGDIIEWLDDQPSCRDVEIYNNIFGSKYFGSESAMKYHDKNIYSKEGGTWSPGDEENSSLEYPDRFELIDAIFIDPDNEDFTPKADSPACDGSVNGLPGVAVGAIPCPEGDYGDADDCIEDQVLLDTITAWKEGDEEISELLSVITSWMANSC